jgi:hypothetical protein
MATDYRVQTVLFCVLTAIVVPIGAESLIRLQDNGGRFSLGALFVAFTCVAILAAVCGFIVRQHPL